MRERERQRQIDRQTERKRERQRQRNWVEGERLVSFYAVLCFRC